MVATIDENSRPGVGAFNPERFGKLESDVEYIKRDVAELNDQVKELRAETTAEFKSVRAETTAEFKSLRAEMTAEFKSLRAEMTTEFKSLRAEARTDFRWLISLLLGLIGLMLAGFGGILTAMAKGFHWIG